MRNEIREWLQKTAAEHPAVSHEEVYELCLRGNPSVVSGVSLGYRVNSSAAHSEVSVWSNQHSGYVATVSGQRDASAPFGFEWLHLLYAAAAELLENIKTPHNA